MIRLIFATILAGALTSPGLAQAGTTKQHVELLDGTSVRMIGARDKPLYIKFWATWCPQCRAQMPHLESLHEKHGAVIDFVAVNIGFSDPIEQVKKFRLEQALSVPVAYEPSHWLAKAVGAPFMEGLGIPLVPYSVVIDRNGRIIHSGIGNKGMDAVISRLVARE